MRSVKRTLLWSILGTVISNVLLFVLLALLVREPQSMPAPGTAPIRVSTAPALPELQRQPQQTKQSAVDDTAPKNFRPEITLEQVEMQSPAVIPSLSPTPNMHATMQEFSLLPSLPTPKLDSADLRAAFGDAMGFPPQVYAVTELDSPIQPLTQTPFVYPLRAKHKGIEGWVSVALQVGMEGNIEAVEVLEAEPKGVFEESVTRSIRAWRFSPATVMGERVKTRVVTTIRFELED